MKLAQLEAYVLQLEAQRHPENERPAPRLASEADRADVSVFDVEPHVRTK